MMHSDDTSMKKQNDAIDREKKRSFLLGTVVDYFPFCMFLDLLCIVGKSIDGGEGTLYRQYNTWRLDVVWLDMYEHDLLSLGSR